MDGRRGVDLEGEQTGLDAVELGEIAEDLVAPLALRGGHRENTLDELLPSVTAQVRPERAHDVVALGQMVDLEALHQLVALGEEFRFAGVTRAQELEPSEIAILGRDVLEVVGKAGGDPLLVAARKLAGLDRTMARDVLLRLHLGLGLALAGGLGLELTSLAVEPVVASGADDRVLGDAVECFPETGPQGLDDRPEKTGAGLETGTMCGLVFDRHRVTSLLS